MKLMKELRNLLVEFLRNEITVASWGISNIEIDEKSISFSVSGFKYHGRVEIFVCEGNGYCIRFTKDELKIIELGEVIPQMDDYIEHSENFEQDLENWFFTNFN